MVLEVALLDILPGSEPAFRDAYALGREHLQRSRGCRAVRLTQGVETPTRFVLLVEWDSIEDHEAFRASEAFGAWRGLVGPHFSGPPVVEHFTDV